MKLPAPREKLFGCMWLARLRAKAQQVADGALPPDYLRAFCHPHGVDGHFLAHFNADEETLLAACNLPDDAFEAWFRALPGNSDAHITAWNEIAVNLGKPGYPMASRFRWALSQYYNHLTHIPLETVFDALEADEAIAQP